MANWVPEVEYLSTGANRHGAVADWSVDGVLAFGADANVALWKPEVSSAASICRGNLANKVECSLLALGASGRF